MPEVMECHKVTGDMCYLIKVKVKNTKKLEKLIDIINKVAKKYVYISSIIHIKRDNDVQA